MFDRSGISIREVPLRGIPYRFTLEPVRLAGYRPAPYRKSPRVGQLVSIAPNVNVQVQTGIEKYLFPVGLMAGGASLFILGTAIPMDLRWTTTLAGLGLMGSGVGVLIYRGTQVAAPAAPAGSAPAPAPGTPPAAAPPVGQGTQAPYVAPAPSDFASLQVQVISPQPDDTISHTGGFLGFGSENIPIQVRFYNPTQNDVTFNLNFAWTESPAFSGYNRDISNGTQTFQVTVAAGEEKNQTFNLPIQTTEIWTQMQVAMSMSDQRTPGDNPQLLSNITFTVT